MTKPKFTPEPWWVLREGSDLSVEPGIASWSKFDIMGRTEEERQARWQEIQANAALIAQCPNMIEFICDIVSACDYGTETLSDQFRKRGAEIIRKVYGTEGNND